jgi:hypothetical protein
MLIDPFATDWLDRILSSEDDVPTGISTYLLIDGAFLPGFHREIKAVLEPSSEVELLFATLPSCSEKTKDVSPFLFRFESPSPQLLSRLQKCSTWPMISVIQTTETLTELAARLAAWCVVETDGQRFNFRFADTRRLAAIFNSLRPKQQGEMKGPAIRWLYMGRDGAWAQLTIASEGSAQCGVAEKPSLDDAQFAAMVSDSEGDEILSILERNGVEMPTQPSVRYASIIFALQTADTADLDSETRLAWCREWISTVPVCKPDRAKAMFAEWLKEINAIDSEES